MKRYVAVGGVCLFAGFALNTCVRGLARLESAPANALAGSEDRMYAKKSLQTFGQNDADEMEEAEAGAPPMAAPVQSAIGGFGSARGGGGKKLAMREDAPGAPPPPPAAEAPATPGRAWFPETFLFEPLVVTDASGLASVPVKVPDRLTNWRVLALAHSRSGAQAGAVSSFAGTLPTYVDPVLPPFLRAGDVVRVPVQVVNTTGSPVTRPLKVEAQGAAVEGGSRTVTVPAAGSVVEYVTVRAAQPGPVTLRASLGGTDSVVRTFDVWPTGRPVVETHGGTLAAPRTLELVGPENAVAGSERVRLLVFPGALGVLRSELSAAFGRGGVAEDAYALLLAGRAPELLTSLGGTADAESLKRMSALAGQRVLRAGRAPDVASAALLAEAALVHPDNPVLARLGERLSGQVASAQRPDGTCQGADGWTLQRLLVATADCARAVRAGTGSDAGRRRASAFGARVSGAFERYVARVQDGYTAAAVLASGGVSGTVRDTLRKQVREALQKRPDGSAFLPVGPGVVRADGVVPSETEATALAVLALVDDKEAPLADLGTSLLADYRPERGWGDGRANLVGLRAALALFKEPLPSQVSVVLERDGKVVTEGTFDAKALREVLALEGAATGSAGKHTWVVRAEPAVPGLGFSLTLGAYVPWRASETGKGLELAVKGPAEVKVGMPAEVTVQAASPAGMSLTLRQGLPAGVQVDRASLDALVNEGKVTSYEVEDGAVSLTLPPRGAAEPFSARFRVVPTLSGTLQAGASSLTPVDRPELVFHVPPATWAVR
ncbi:alpha-2-macroglobulin family protein [Archangium violaceum]|uniref:alpha-2-macroglobulin family protein n=1 Tax=Archangium violaceum TaxID=83451 RepID=UPI002B321696|nr:alpha-2-macroglobulin family protein [Archangium gephyra]